MRYRVTNTTRNTLLADDAGRADTFFGRLKGLMGVAALPTGQALHIVPCNSIHTFFMKIDIDAVFLTRENEVVEVVHAMPPWRMGRLYRAAASVLELPAGTARAAKTEPGDRLSFEPRDRL